MPLTKYKVSHGCHFTYHILYLSPGEVLTLISTNQEAST